MAALALSPTQAALIAANVYNIRAQSVSEAQKGPGIGVTGKNFNVQDQNRFTGRTGAEFTQPLLHEIFWPKQQALVILEKVSIHLEITPL